MLKPLKIIGASLGLGLGGTAISQIDSNIGSKISDAGQTTSKFIAPAVNIAMGGYLIKQLKDLKKKKNA